MVEGKNLAAGYRAQANDLADVDDRSNCNNRRRKGEPFEAEIVDASSPEVAPRKADTERAQIQKNLDLAYPVGLDNISNSVKSWQLLSKQAVSKLAFRQTFDERYLPGQRNSQTC